MKTLLNKAVFINKELVDHFKLLFPNTLPMKKGITQEEIAFLQGQQSVIERMTFILDDDLTEEN